MFDLFRTLQSRGRVQIDADDNHRILSVRAINQLGATRFSSKISRLPSIISAKSDLTLNALRRPYTAHRITLAYWSPLQ